MESLLQLQGDASSHLTPLFLIHAISGLALPYLSLGSLSNGDERPVYGISSPFYERRSYILPPTLAELAEDYVNLIRNEVQPHGPYILGGWSMGGMIATRMAALLESQGEEVLHVILIDSANPEEIPEFVGKDHEILTTLTFNFLARGLANEEVSDMDQRGSDSSDSSIYDGETYDDELDASEMEKSDSSEEDEDNEISFLEWLPRMREHISNGLALIAAESASSTAATSAPVTLIKCGVLNRIPSTLSESRKMAIQKLFHDSRSGWKFTNFNTLKLSGAAHDEVLDLRHAGELTGLMEMILDGLRC